MEKQPLEKQSEQEIWEWVKQQPEVLRRLGRLRAVSREAAGDPQTLAEAERAVIAEIDAMGAEVLKGWMERKEKECREAAAKPGVRKHSKKNSW